LFQKCDGGNAPLPNSLSYTDDAREEQDDIYKNITKTE
jgi:hypothetical protein